MKWLEPDDFEFLCFDLARKLMSFQEPIPDYSTRENNLLEASLGAPKQTFEGKFLYPTIEKQGSILFYSLIKNHPFRNGNKRIAVMALLAFLSLNGKWINVKPEDLYDFACTVSESKATEKDDALKIIEKTLTRNLINFPER